MLRASSISQVDFWEELTNASKYHEDTYGQIDHTTGEKLAVFDLYQEAG